MYLLLGIVAAVVVVLVIVLLARKSKSDIATDGTQSPLNISDDSRGLKAHDAVEASSAVDELKSAEADGASHFVDSDDSGLDKTGSPEESKYLADSGAGSDVQIEIAPEGVRLDESAEQTAVLNLKQARRERKLQKLRQGLQKTRGGLISKIGALFSGKKELDSDLLDQLEEVLITSDVGAKTTQWLIDLVKGALDKDELKNPDAVWALLKQEIRHLLDVKAEPINFSTDKPFTIMVVGVNGAGKTTTIGKLASQFSENGQQIVLAAADTFRAAAVNQLEIWGRRTNSEVVKPAREGADPSSVVFDAVKKATEISADIVIADTAGRLHTQAPLMEELKKIHRVMGKAQEGAPHEIFLVLDATNGQNALQQVKEFGEALKITGIVLTKLDGTAKGGVIIGICHEYKIPIRYIGIGEAKDSLRTFDVDDFVDALFVQENEAE